MQQQAWAQGPNRSGRIKGIAQYGVANALQVNAQLVRASGHGF